MWHSAAWDDQLEKFARLLTCLHFPTALRIGSNRQEQLAGSMGTALIALEVALVSILLLFLFCPSTLRRWFSITAISAPAARAGWTLPPGPKGWPILGNLPDFGKGLEATLAEFARKFGGIVYLELGFKPVVLVTSSSVARIVLREQDSLFCDRPPPPTVVKQLTYLEDQIPFDDYGPRYTFRRYVARERERRCWLIWYSDSISEVPWALLFCASMNSHMIDGCAQEDNDAGAVEPTKGDSVQAPQRIRARCAC